MNNLGLKIGHSMTMSLSRLVYLEGLGSRAFPEGPKVPKHVPPSSVLGTIGVHIYSYIWIYIYVTMNTSHVMLSFRSSSDSALPITGMHLKALPRLCEYGVKKLRSPACSR